MRGRRIATSAPGRLAPLLFSFFSFGDRRCRDHSGRVAVPRLGAEAEPRARGWRPGGTACALFFVEQLAGRGRACYAPDMTEGMPLIRLGSAARIGLVADTHCHRPGASDLPGSVLDAFRGVDLVIHLGDMGDVAALDRLEGVARVVATRGRDDPPEDHRIAPTARVVEAGGLVLGALFDLTTAGLASLEGDHLSFPGELADGLVKVFGRRVDIVAFGATHRDLIGHHRGVLFVNPGSATLPARPGAGGTAALLELRDSVAVAEIVRV
jgi:uncharacterized protein